MAQGPCLNPNCKSNGRPHPNCRCYAGMAEGGQVGHFCEQKQPHGPSCEYFAKGGEASGFIPDNQFKADIQEAPAGFISDDVFKPDAQSNEQAANAQIAKEEELDTKHAGQGPLAAIESVGKGILGPLAAASQSGMRKGASALGVPDKYLNKIAPKPEDVASREEAFPVTSTAGTLAGLMSPIGQGAVLEKAGVALAERAVPHVVEEGILKGISRQAVKGAAENAMFQAGDETTKMIQNDPNQSVESAVSNIGLVSVLGGAVGGGLGSISPLWKAAVGEKAGQMVSDFKTRMREHLELPEVSEPLKIHSEIGPISSAEPITKEAFDPFTKKTTTITVTPRAPNTGPKIDPFTKEVMSPGDPIPSGKMPEIKSLAKTDGGKLADMFIQNADKLSGKAAGSAIGAFLGHVTGIPYGGTIGAILGERALSPILESVLPAIAKPIIDKLVSGEGIKAATDYGMAVAKGAKLADNAVTGLFKSGSKLIPDSRQPDENSRKKLEVALQSIQKDPERITQVGGQIGHYLPNHAVALGSMTSNVSSFLNSLRPQSQPKALLDTPKPVPRAVQAQYDRALDIAQQPLTVLESAKNGTITSHDVIALQKMYPTLYQNLKQKIMSSLVSEVSKGETIPYELKLGLSIFMGQPLDSTMQPMSIMASQPTPQPQPEQQQGKKLTQDAGSKMIKGSKSLQTATQASEAMHSSGAKA